MGSFTFLRVCGNDGSHWGIDHGSFGYGVPMYHSEMRKAQPLDYEDKETHDAPHGSPVHSSHVHSSALAIVFQATN